MVQRSSMRALSVFAAFTALVLTAVAPAATATADTASVAKPSVIRLTVKVDAGDGVWQQWSLKCGPTGGTHPQRYAACKRLLKADGRSLFTPVPADVMCTMIYGGSQRAIVTGIWKGKPLKAGFSRTDGCQIARWERAQVLFPIEVGVAVS